MHTTTCRHCCLTGKFHSERKAAGTIAGYLTVAKTFHTFLVVNGMATKVPAITRDRIEHFLEDLFERTAPATVAKHYRSLQQRRMPCLRNGRNGALVASSVSSWVWREARGGIQSSGRLACGQLDIVRILLGYFRSLTL